MAFATPFELTNQFYGRTERTRTFPLEPSSPKKNTKHPIRFTPLSISIPAGIPSQVNGKSTPGKHTDPIITNHHRLRVAYQGVAGAYSEFAANTAVPNCITVSCRTFEEAITSVEAGHADRAVLPVESTMEGATVRNYDILLQHKLQIVQEINLFVHYCLLAMPGVRKGELRRVISHPMALAHCGRTLAQLGLDAYREPVHDTAGAVELLLSQRMLDTAAIASPRAASLYGLQVLVNGLQDESWNVTRFLILSKETKREEFHESFVRKTSMVIGHQGKNLEVLLRVLSSFSSRNINLTKLEVKPFEDNKPSRILDVRGGGFVKECRHVLYVDFEGSMDDRNARDAIVEISQLPVYIRILGSYALDPQIYDLQ